MARKIVINNRGSHVIPARKIFINDRGFYVIPECKNGDYTLCVASEPWGESTWGEDANGQQILDIADNRNPESMTSYWYNSLPDIIKAAMLTVRVTTDDNNEAGKGLLEQTEMFVPSYSEWRKIPRDVREIIAKVAKDNCLWSRSYYGAVYGSSGAWFVYSNGNVYGNGGQGHSYVVAPAFYISDNLLESLIRKSDNEMEDKKVDKLIKEIDRKIKKIRETTFTNDRLQNEGIKTILINELYDVRVKVEELFN